MTTQAQGKGKKKNKESTKLTLEEFNQIDAPHGHSVVNVKMGLDWAAEMADHEQNSETKLITVPTVPRAQRGPNIQMDQLPDSPPFLVSLYNVPIGIEANDLIERFFAGIDVVKADVAKTSTTVELASRDAMYDALCKDGVSIRNKTINVCLYGQQPQNSYSDKYGGRSGNSYGDRYSDRSQGGGFGGSRMGDRGPGGGFTRDRDNYGGFNREGRSYGQQRGGYGDRFQDRSSFRDSGRGSGGGEPAEEADNWRAGSRPVMKPTPSHAPSYNGSRQPYTQSRSEPSYYNQHPPHYQQYNQSESYHQSRHAHHQPASDNVSPSQYNDRSGPNSRPQSVSEAAEERPKLVLSKRKTPLNIDDVSSVKRNEAIFGQAKPSSLPYQKMHEVEEKLKTVQLSDKIATPPLSGAGSQAGSQPGSAPRSRQLSERSRD